MIEVLHFPRHSDARSFYRSSALPHSPPSSSLFLDPSPFDLGPKTASAPTADYQEPFSAQTPDSSFPPSTSSSFSTISSATSDASSLPDNDYFPDSGLTLRTHIDFPNYDNVSYGGQHPGGTTSPPSSPASCEEEPMTETTLSDSPLPTPTVVDDTAITEEPSRQVDFLSHNWKEEDIWASWRHIVSQRKALYGEKSRLENASWRTWAKTKFDLRTVSPERLNWLKESDVTWLYGPLKSATSYPISQDQSAPESQISKNNSFINKKPILKKRSVSEVMLQKSLSTSSLVKQATDRVQAQGRSIRRPSLHDGVDSKIPSETPSRDQVYYLTSRTISEMSTPNEIHEKRHIRFDERVEQCIAVDCKDSMADFEEESEEEDNDDSANQGSDSSSDDGIVMMKRKKRPDVTHRKKSEQRRSSSTNGRKTIETLPATTLKYRTDSPDIPQKARYHTFGSSWSNGVLSPSPSQETLRPAHPSSNFLRDDGDEDVDSESSWSFGVSNPKSSLGASVGAVGRKDALPASRVTSPGPSGYEISGMRRTSSGMFMPVDDHEDDIVASGLLGRVSETINTARDIAHVIWNVGWRSG